MSDDKQKEVDREKFFGKRSLWVSFNVLSEIAPSVPS